ncbi:mRNA-decapping enzyme-like protein [Ananas comosus]|uniref:mRNA-decapping enzyme-like protein n=1 Tax=Ananas comosus TaxID=4615 RepID=A0A199V497_ANACO|nr:mRNA-decapping enzyme-like protein [Ananas comosus]
MSQGEKLIPNFDPQVIKELNLTVLRRIDPFVEEILFIASHVALYVLNVELMQWRRKDVDGALFVVKSRLMRLIVLIWWLHNYRNNQARFQFIVLNRRGPGMGIGNRKTAAILFPLDMLYRGICKGVNTRFDSI